MTKFRQSLAAGILASTTALAGAGCAIKAPVKTTPVAVNPDIAFTTAHMTELQAGCTFYNNILGIADEHHFDGANTVAQNDIAAQAQQNMLLYTSYEKFFDPEARKFDENVVKFTEAEKKDKVASLTMGRHTLVAQPPSAPLNSYADHCGYLQASAVAIAQETDIQISRLFEYAVTGALAASRDAHTSYLWQEASEQRNDDMKGEFGGIGVTYSTTKDGKMEIGEVTPDGPADKAGLKKGDRITKIDGQSIAGKRQDQLSTIIRGKPGTSLVATVERGDQTLDLPITREIIKIHDVTSELVGTNKDEALVKIKKFSESVAKDVYEQLAKLDQEADAKGTPLKGVILDVRDNPGGLLQAVEVMADFFIESKNSQPSPIVATGKTAMDSQFLADTAVKGSVVDVPIVVMQNGHSASASEVLAGSLEDDGKDVVGQPSFGKGSVQVPIAVSAEGKPVTYKRGPFGSYIKDKETGDYIPNEPVFGSLVLTIQAFFPGKTGLSNQNSGVIPTVKVQYNDIRDEAAAKISREVDQGRVIGIPADKTRASQTPKSVCSLNKEFAGPLSDDAVAKLPAELVDEMRIFNETTKEWGEPQKFLDADLACTEERIEGSSPYTTTVPFNAAGANDNQPAQQNAPAKAAQNAAPALRPR